MLFGRTHFLKLWKPPVFHSASPFFLKTGRFFLFKATVFFFRIATQKIHFCEVPWKGPGCFETLVGKVSFERFLFEGPDFRIAIQVSLDQRRVAA